MIKWVKVKFGNYPREYSYKSKTQGIKVGDELVVKTSEGKKIVQCVGVFENDPPAIATSTILGKLVIRKK